MKFKVILIFTLSMMFLEGTAQSDDVKISMSDTLKLTVRKAISIASKRNPELAKVRLNEDILNQQVLTAKASALPQLSGKAGYTDNFALPTQLLPGEVFGQEGSIPVKFGVRYGLNAGIEANQILYNKEFFENIKKLDATKSTYQLQTLSSTEDLVYNVVQAYLQYQIIDIQNDLLQDNLERTNQLVKMAQAQLDNGIIKKIEVDQLRVNRTNLESELSNVELNMDQQLNVIRFYLGLDMGQPILLVEELAEDNRYPLSQQLLLDENINFQLIQKQRELALLDNNVIKASYLPTLTAFAQYNYTGQANKFNFKKDNYSGFGAGLWGLNVSVLIFDGGQKAKKLQENKIKLMQIEWDEKIVRASTEMAFDNANKKIRQSQVQLNVQTENMALANEVYEVTQLSYREGVAPLSELLNTESSLKEAQSQYLNSILNFRLAELEHVKTSGQLAQMIKSEL